MGQLLVVEDPFDAIKWRALGLNNTAALCGSLSKMTPQRWERLAQHGVTDVTLIVGEQNVRRELLSTTLQHSFRARKCPELWVASFDYPRAGTQRKKTAADLPRVVADCRVHAFHVQATAILERHCPLGEWDRKMNKRLHRAVLDEAIDFYVSLADRKRASLDRHFVPPILAALGLDKAPEPKPAKKRPKKKPRGTSNPGSRGWCRMHNCSIYDCFCFD